MLSTSPLRRIVPRHHLVRQLRRASTNNNTQKRAGDISDAFASLSGQTFKPLDPRYADLKKRLINGHEEALRDSWVRLLNQLRKEVPVIAALGSGVIPEIEFKDIDSPSKRFNKAYRDTGVAVIRNVVPEQEALKFKSDLREYIKKNPQTKGIPSNLSIRHQATGTNHIR
jgi:hypothetical protein